MLLRNLLITGKESIPSGPDQFKWKPLRKTCAKETAKRWFSSVDQQRWRLLQLNG